MTRTIALDLGTKTGWAIADDSELVGCGTILLLKDSERKAAAKVWPDLRAYDPRPGLLHSWIISRASEVPNGSTVHLIFEDVQFSSYTLQVQLWASLRAAVWISLIYAPVAVKFSTLAVGTLKKAATGHGNATKDMMGAAAKRVSGLDLAEGLDDNAIDALHLLRYAVPGLRKKTT